MIKCYDDKISIGCYINCFENINSNARVNIHYKGTNMNERTRCLSVQSEGLL